MTNKDETTQTLEFDMDQMHENQKQQKAEAEETFQSMQAFKAKVMEGKADFNSDELQDAAETALLYNGKDIKGEQITDYHDQGVYYVLAEYYPGREDDMRASAAMCHAILNIAGSEKVQTLIGGSNKNAAGIEAEVLANFAQRVAYEQQPLTEDELIIMAAFALKYEYDEDGMRNLHDTNVQQIYEGHDNATNGEFFDELDIEGSNIDTEAPIPSLLMNDPTVAVCKAYIDYSNAQQ